MRRGVSPASLGVLLARPRRITGSPAACSQLARDNWAKANRPHCSAPPRSRARPSKRGNPGEGALFLLDLDAQKTSELHGLLGANDATAQLAERARHDDAGNVACRKVYSKKRCAEHIRAR